MIEIYNSIKEVRYFCNHNKETIEGSISISEIPTLTTEQSKCMFAVKNKDGLYLSLDNKYVIATEIKSIRFFTWYLQTEESTVGTSNRSVGMIELIEEIINIKDEEISALTIALNHAHSRIDELVENKKLDGLKMYELQNVVDKVNYVSGCVEGVITEHAQEE